MKPILIGAALALLGAPALAESLVITSEVPATHWKSDYVEEFKSLVEERSGGEIEVKFYPAGQLYSDQDALAAIGTGSVQMVWPVSSHLESLDKQMGLLSLPFTLSDEIMGNPEFSAELASYLSGEMSGRGMGILGLLRTSDAIIVTRDHPVEALEDLKNLRIRAPGGAAFRNLTKAVGANPTSLPASEMVTAISQGVIDGAITSPAGWKTILADSADAGFIVPGMMLATYAIVVDTAWLDGLSDQNREAVVSAAKDVAAGQWSKAVLADKADLQEMLDRGKTFAVIDGAENAAFREALQPIIDGYAEENTEMWDAYLALVAKYE